MGVAVVLALMILVLVVLRQDVFLTWANINNILRGSAITLVLATGTTLLLTAGVIDLSIGSMVALCTMVLAGFLNLGWPALAAVVGTIVVGAALRRGRQRAARRQGEAVVLRRHAGHVGALPFARPTPHRGSDDPAHQQGRVRPDQTLGDGKIGPLSVPVILSFGVSSQRPLMRSTSFGRAIFAVGGNGRRSAGRNCVDGVRVAALRSTEHSSASPP